jgi:hypothetical protein
VLLRSWSAGIAGLLVMLAAGCTNAAAPHPARTWHGFSSGCPVLTAPPYGVATKGTETTNTEDPGEREILDQVVPGAKFDEVTCVYTAPGRVSPRIAANVKVFGGAGGAKQATAVITQGFDKAHPLQQQLPALKPVMTDVLTGLE